MSASLEGYKQTELGVIPVEWNVLTCCEVCSKIQDGTHFSPQLGGNDFLYITSKNIRFGFLDFANADRIDSAQHEAIYKRCDVKRGDLLLTKDGANTGNAALNDVDEEFSLLSSVAFLRLLPHMHDAAYLLQQILSGFGQRQIKEAMSGNAITRLTLEKIKRLRFPFPSWEEQRAIAVALSDVDALLAKLDQLIAKKRDLKQASMQQLLTGKTRLPQFNGAWNIRLVGDLIISQKKTIRPSSSGRSEGIYPFFTNTTKPVDKYLDEADFNTEAIIANTGGVAYFNYYNGSFAAMADCYVFETKIETRFLYYVLKLLERKINENGFTGSGIKHLDKKYFHQLEVSIPADITEQRTIAAALKDMDSEITALEARREKIRELKQGMMQELLAGKIRLI